MRNIIIRRGIIMSKHIRLGKLVSIIACTAMLLTLLPAAMVQAADLNALTIESITNHQPENMITKDLTLAEGYEWTAEPGGIVDTATGVITRDAFTDKTVTLTAATGESSKSFTLVVKSKKTKVMVSDNFAYDYAETDNAMAQDNFVFKTEQTNIPHVIATDENGNRYLTLDWTDTTGKTGSKPVYLKNDINVTSGEVYITFKYKYSAAGGSPLANIQVKAGDTYCQSASLSKYGNQAVFGFRSPRWYDSGFTYSGYNADGTDLWKTAKVKYDISTGNVAIGDDDHAFTEGKNVSAANAAVSGFCILPGSLRDNCGKLLVDDFVIYTESIDNLTDEDKKAVIDSALNIENITTQVTGALTTNYTPDYLTLSSGGGLVNWTSSDPSIISVEGEKGVIKKFGGEVSKPVILSAAYEGGVRRYNFAVAPTKWTTTVIGTSGKLAEDFERGTDGQQITVENAASHTARTGWGKLNDGLVPTFTYLYDENKGMVGSLTGNDGEETSLSLLAGVSGAAQRFVTGFDVKVEKGSFEFEMNSVLPYEKIVLTNNKIDVYTDGGIVKSFNIEPDANGWVRVDIDSNWAARAQNVYINGQALSDMPMKNMLYTTMNTSDIGAALRWIDIKLGSGAKALIDNIAVTRYVSINTALADAGVKAAQLFYLDKEISAKTLETYGPSEHNGGVYDISENFENQHGSSKRATLTWSGDAVNGNIFTPTAIGEYTLTVTATSTGNGWGDDTKTGTFTIKAAPTVINTSNGKISVTGVTNGGMLLIAQYDETGKFINATVYNDSFTDIQAPSGNCRYFFFEKETLKPLALSK